MATISVSSELPLPAHTAAALARKPAVMQFVLSPLVRTPGLVAPDRVGVGTRVTARLWFLGLLPTWRHTIEVRRLDDLELYTNEHGGPVRTWNHRLIFTPVGEDRCRYTDEIETDPGFLGAATRAFAWLLFRHRHRRWRQLADIVS